MTFDSEKCKNCSRYDLCAEGIVECIVSDKYDITTDMDTETVEAST